MIKNIIFDLGNVIINYDQERIISNFTEDEEERNYIYNEIFNVPEWLMMDLGNLTNDEVIGIVNKRNNYKYDDLTNEFLHEWYKKQPMNENVVELARKLKNNGYKIFVLSNMASSTYEYFKNEDFFSLCDGIVISAHEHLIKPDEKVYKLLLERYDLNANECVFIDDDPSGENYKSANKLGIKGRKVLRNDVDDIKKMLSEFEINL